MTEYVFDTDVPFPAKLDRSPLGAKCAAMIVGNSFVHDAKSPPSFWYITKSTGFEFRHRKVADGQYRIWRVK